MHRFLCFVFDRTYEFKYDTEFDVRRGKSGLLLKPDLALLKYPLELVFVLFNFQV